MNDNNPFNTDFSTQVCDAIGGDDKNAVITLIESIGINIDNKSNDGYICRFLVHASIHGNIDLIKYFLDFDFNLINEKYNPLTDIIFYTGGKSRENTLDTIKLLLNDPRIDINAFTIGREYRMLFSCAMKTANPLLLAVLTSRYDIVKLLLEYDNINVNCSAEDGETPFYKAATVGSPDIAILLLNDERVDPNIYCGNYTALQSLLLKCHLSDVSTSLVKYMLKHPRVDSYMKTKDGKSPFELFTNKYKEIYDHYN